MRSPLNFSLLFTLMFTSAQVERNYFLDLLQVIKTLPLSNSIEDVNFSLYTHNSSVLRITTIKSNDLKDVVAPFKFIVHGWQESSAKPYFKAMTAAYFQRGNYNVVHVNWSSPASVDYTSAARNTAKVGIVLGEFVAHLCEVSSTKLEDIHLLGHSLGAHVVGVAGKEVFKRTGNKVGRITGLDPAGPLFEGLLSSNSRRLHKDDAKMVDVVHTDAGFFGYKEPIGTVDFFPNGGMGLQPGCSLPMQGGDVRILKSATEYVFCSHIKSHTYYIESINSKSMLAVKCDSWADFQINACYINDTIPFGEDAPSGASGKYYFRTTNPHLLKKF